VRQSGKTQEEEKEEEEEFLLTQIANEEAQCFS
jgi:hypothetical protein